MSFTRPFNHAYRRNTKRKRYQTKRERAVSLQKVVDLYVETPNSIPSTLGQSDRYEPFRRYVSPTGQRQELLSNTGAATIFLKIFEPSTNNELNYFCVRQVEFDGR